MQARKGTIWFEVGQFDFLVVCGWSDTDTTLLIPFMHREIFSQDMYVHFFYLCNGFFPAHWMGVNFPVSSGHVLFEAYFCRISFSKSHHHHPIKVKWSIANLFFLMIHFQFYCQRWSNSCCKITPLVSGVLCNNLTAMTKAYPARPASLPTPVPRKWTNVKDVTKLCLHISKCSLKNLKTAIWRAIFHKQSGWRTWFLACPETYVATSNKTNSLIYSFCRLWLDLSTTRMTRMRTKMKAKRAAPQKEHDWTLPSICLGASSARGAGSCVASQPGQNFDNCIRNILSQQKVETCREHESKSREIQCQAKISHGQVDPPIFVATFKSTRDF